MPTEELLITIEGPTGSGKTRCAALIAEALSAALNRDVVVREVIGPWETCVRESGARAPKDPKSRQQGRGTLNVKVKNR